MRWERESLSSKQQQILDEYIDIIKRFTNSVKEVANETSPDSWTNYQHLIEKRSEAFSNSEQAGIPRILIFEANLEAYPDEDSRQIFFELSVKFGHLTYEEEEHIREKYNY